MKPHWFIAAFGLLTACTASDKTNTADTPLSVMTRITRQAQACWFKPGNATFAKYKLASELNSYAGRPRILIVPKNNPSGLPVLVVQAERKAGRNNLTSFGPLLSSAGGGELRRDIQTWSTGARTC